MPKVPGYISLLSELVGTLEAFSLYCSIPFVKENVAKRYEELKRITIEDIPVNDVVDELLKAKKINHVGTETNLQNGAKKKAH